MNNNKEEVTKDFNKTTTTKWHKNYKDNSVTWEEYNVNNDLIFSASIQNDKIEIFKNKYDSNGYLISSKDSKNNIERFFQYDKKGNCIYYKDTQGLQAWGTYDKNGNQIYKKSSDGRKIWFKYDKNNNIIYKKTNHGDYEQIEYDKNNNEIHYKDSTEREYWQEFDENSNLIYFKNNVGYEERYEYDENGNEIYYRNNEGKEVWTNIISDIKNQLNNKIKIGEIEKKSTEEELNYKIKTCQFSETFEEEIIKDDKLLEFRNELSFIEQINFLTNDKNLAGNIFSEMLDDYIFMDTFKKEKLEMVYDDERNYEGIFSITSKSINSNEKLYNIYYTEDVKKENILLNSNIKDFDEAKVQLLKYATNMNKYENLFSQEEKTINNFPQNYINKTIDILSKDNPSIALTTYIKQLTNDLSDTQKISIFTEITKELNKEIINLIEKNNSQNYTNSNKGKGR